MITAVTNHQTHVFVLLLNTNNDFLPILAFVIQSHRGSLSLLDTFVFVCITLVSIVIYISVEKTAASLGIIHKDTILIFDEPFLFPCFTTMVIFCCL